MTCRPAYDDRTLTDAPYAMLRRIAPAKINLGLHVLRKRDDGYHDIETVFVRIPWFDVLRARPADDLQLECSEPRLPTGEENLVVRAARCLDASLGAHVELEKRLPVGAGLGGGSSDAAAALLLFNDLWELGRSREDLVQLAAAVGSDVPFFVAGSAAATGTGRGDELEPLIDPRTGEVYALPYWLVVAVPPVRVSTADAYRSVRPEARNRPDLRDVVLSSDLRRWREELTNDFEAPLLASDPVIAETKTAFERAGAGYASVSGSGSAVFGVFDEAANAEAAAAALRQAGHRTWHGTVTS